MPGFAFSTITNLPHHDCPIDGGYQWCEKTQKCQQEPCETPKKFSPNFDRSFVSCKNKMYGEYRRQQILLQQRYNSVIESDKSCQTIRKELDCGGSQYSIDCNSKAWEHISDKKMVCSELIQDAKTPGDHYYCSKA